MDDFTGSRRKRPYRAQRIKYLALNDIPPEDRIIAFPPKGARKIVEPVDPDD
jgi:hypothetical protein